jgi:hypothetical protein
VKLVAVLTKRRRPASADRTPQARLRPESLLADRDDAQARIEAAARSWRRRT